MLNAGNLKMIQSGKFVGAGKMGQIVSSEYKQSQGRIHTRHGTSYAVSNITTPVTILKPVINLTVLKNSVHTAQKMRSVSIANTSSTHYRYL